eukprot:5378787-Pleurochrysis_carterae.AAC.1
MAASARRDVGRMVAQKSLVVVHSMYLRASLHAQARFGAVSWHTGAIDGCPAVVGGVVRDLGALGRSPSDA